MRYGISQKTVAKWKRRTLTADQIEIVRIFVRRPFLERCSEVVAC